MCGTAIGGWASVLARAAGLLTCVMIMTLPAQAQTVPAHPAQAVMDADRAFAAMALKTGAGPAFGHYAEADVSMFNQPEPKTTAAELAKGFPPDLVIEWAPVDGAMSADGTLGYTWGKATYHRKKPDGTQEELPPSRYVTIWRKQADGSWKFLGDGGLKSPEEKAFLDRKKAEK